MNKIKRIILKVLCNFYNNTWSEQKKYKLIIMHNKYFTIRKWNEILSREFILYKDTEIKFTKNKYELINLIYEADAAFLWGIPNAIDLNKSKIKFIYFGTSGTEFLNNRAIPEKIKLKTARGIAATAIAEYVLAFALLLNRNLNYPVSKRYKWVQDKTLKEEFNPLSQKKVGIIGYGANGKEIAKYFKKIGCEIFVIDIHHNEDQNVDKFFSWEDKEIFLGQVDILVLAVPLNKQTFGLVNQSFLNLLKDGVIIFNISRGNVINDIDLHNYLKHDKHKIKYLVLDVFEKEPLPFYDWKWRDKRIIITPHIAGNVNLFVEDIKRDFISNLNNILE